MVSKFYKFLLLSSRFFGAWFLAFFTAIITTGFFVFGRKRIGVCKEFYRMLFPGKSWFFYEKCAWKQYHNFSRVFQDRFFMYGDEDISYTSEGWEYLEKAAKNKNGGIILMSHMGNWEVAALFFKKRGLDLMLYMGTKQKEQIEGLQKKGLIESGIKVVAVDNGEGSQFNLLEGVKFLKRGGLVSLTADRIWSKSQRPVEATFLGHKILLPEAPHIFALLSGSPIFIFFVFKTGKKKYHFSISEPYYIEKSSRKERKEALERSVQNYSSQLEDMLRKHPFEWYHFEQFLGEKIE